MFHVRDVLVKGYAAAARVHSAMEGMFDLRLAHGFSAEDIEHLTIGIPKVIEGRLTKPEPADEQAAQMSLPFSVALAAAVPLQPGAIPVVTIADYLERIDDPSLKPLQAKMETKIDPDVEAASGAQSTAAKLVLTLRGGKVVETFVAAPKGSASRPFTRAEHEARFRQELATRISDANCQAVIAISRDLERLDAARLAALLAPSG